MLRVDGTTQHGKGLPASLDVRASGEHVRSRIASTGPRLLLLVARGEVPFNDLKPGEVRITTYERVDGCIVVGLLLEP